MTSTPSRSGRPRSSTTSSGWCRAATAQRLRAGRRGRRRRSPRALRLIRSARRICDLVVDDEDARHVSLLSRSPGRTTSGGRLVGRGQRHHHGQATAGGVLGCQRAAHRLGQAARQGQAEADPGGVVACRRSAGTARTGPRGRPARRPGPGRRPGSRPSRPSRLAVTTTGDRRRRGAARCPRGWPAPAPAARGRRAPRQVRGHVRRDPEGRPRPRPAEGSVSSAGATTSSTADGLQVQASSLRPAGGSCRAGCRPGGRARRATRRRWPAARRWSSAARSTSSLRRLETDALAAAERGPQVVADRGEQGGAHPVGLGQGSRPAAAASQQPLLLARGRPACCGEGGGEPPVRGVEHVAVQGQHEVADRDLVGGRPGASAEPVRRATRATRRPAATPAPSASSRAPAARRRPARTTPGPWSSMRREPGGRLSGVSTLFDEVDQGRATRRRRGPPPGCAGRRGRPRS